MNNTVPRMFQTLESPCLNAYFISNPNVHIKQIAYRRNIWEIFGSRNERKL